MKPPKSRIVAACAATAVLALVLSACGGGGGPTTTVPTLALPAGHEIPADTYTIPAGEDQVLGNVEVSCPAGGMACVLIVPSSTAATGTYETMGGTPTVTPALGSVDLPGGHGIFADTYTIPAGDIRELGNVKVSCPSGGMACVLTVASSTAATGSYPQTGGTPAFNPALGSVDLPTGHAIDADTYTLQAGDTRELGNVDVSCPSGGMACVLTVASSTAATGSYPQTGGTPAFNPALGSVDLPTGHAIDADTYTLQAGDTRDLGNVNVSCPSGGMACVLTVASSTAATGSYPQTGGTPVFNPALGSVDLPTGHAIDADTYTLQAGDTRELGNVNVSCPSGGMACVLTVASSTAATGSYPQTGGTPAFNPALGSVDLPTGHAIDADTYTLRAGETRNVGNVDVSCPSGGMACVLTVASSTAATGSYQLTGSRPTVEPVLADLGLPPYHGIASSDDVEIVSGSTHHGRHGISVACPADGADCVVNFTDDEGKYHTTGGIPGILTHDLVRAANDQEGRAYSVFTRDQEDTLSGLNPVGYHLTNVVTQVTLSGGAIEFELDYPNPSVNREDRRPMLLDALIFPDHTVDDSNIPELQSIDGAPAWTGVALSREDSTTGDAIHANVYSDIEPDRLGAADTDYLVLGVWLEVPDDVNMNTSLLGAFAHGTQRFTSLNAVTGEAAYKGPAIGIYETRESDSSDDISIGSFVADVELSADFDADTITGEIDNFTENDQSLGDWVVNLVSSTGIVQVGGRDIHGNPEISRDGGASFAGSGELEASFYGDSPVFPPAVAGSFWSDVGSRERLATGDEGYLGLTGAFGAYYCPPPCQ